MRTTLIGMVLGVMVFGGCVAPLEEEDEPRRFVELWIEQGVEVDADGYHLVMGPEEAVHAGWIDWALVAEDNEVPRVEDSGRQYVGARANCDDVPMLEVSSAGVSVLVLEGMQWRLGWWE